MTSYEIRLKEILAELLQLPVEQISLEQNMAEQGIDSLLGLRLIRKINDAFAYELELEDLFDYPSIRQLAGFLQQNLAHEA